MLREFLKANLALYECHLFSIVELKEEPRFDFFQKWLKEKKHGQMSYLESHQHCRQDPRLLLEGAQTAIVFGLPYFQNDRKIDFAKGSLISQYARIPDYHKSIRKIGLQIAQDLKSYLKEDNFDFRVTVDTAPVLERALAERSSRGFIGKNTCFIDPDMGSFFLLGAILVNRHLPYDEERFVNPEIRGADGGCGTCRRCQVNCPTGALDEEYKIDASKCLSYWTIENRGVVPTEYWPHFKSYWYGCDICQNVCPYNRGADPISANRIRLNKHLDLFEVATMDQAYYESNFGGTALVRAKKKGLQRNALIAMWARSDPLLARAVAFLLDQSQIEQVLTDTISEILSLNPDLL